MLMNAERSSRLKTESMASACLLSSVYLIYLFSNPHLTSYYDYTLRMAEALLAFRTGIDYSPPEWLNEMIPGDGRYYSAFPLGSVLSMIPAAILRKAGVIGSFPGPVIAALIAAASALLLFKISGSYLNAIWPRVLMSIFPVFGTWMWANLAFGGAWQIALGMAVVGQLGALYFILIRPRPFIAGLFFALAFGNRTEIILLAPVFIYLIYRGNDEIRRRWSSLDRFMIVPVMLGIATLVYNHLRFGNIFDFGYAHIPGVLEEPWYEQGIFSIHAIPGNAYAMMLEPWERIGHSPYLVPSGFGGSIFISSPYLLAIFRSGATDRTLKIISWISILLLTGVLWCHGNTGGWQFSYRYAMELLPWAFLIMLESGKNRMRAYEIVLVVVSIAINIWATYLFLRSGYFRLSG